MNEVSSNSLLKPIRHFDKKNYEIVSWLFLKINFWWVRINLFNKGITFLKLNGTGASRSDVKSNLRATV